MIYCRNDKNIANNVQLEAFNKMAKSIIGRMYFKDGLAPIKNSISVKYDITDIRLVKDCLYSAVFQGTLPIIIETENYSEAKVNSDLSNTVVVTNIEIADDYKDKKQKDVKASLEIGDTVYFAESYKGYHRGELIAYNYPMWTVRLGRGLEIQCYEDEFDVNASFGMGSDGANTIYLLDKKEKSITAAKLPKMLPSQREINKKTKEMDKRLNDSSKAEDEWDRLNNGEKETWQVLQEKSKQVKLNDRAAKTLATTYEKLNQGGKEAIDEYLQNLKSDIPSPVVLLLGQMIEEVPLKTYKDIQDVGFEKDAAKEGSSDDLFALKAACGLKQAEKNKALEELFKNGQFKPRKEIERIVVQNLEKLKREDPKKQQVIDTLKNAKWEDDTIAKVLENTYDAKLSTDSNLAKAFEYKANKKSNTKQ